MATRKFKGMTITDDLPKKGDIIVCIQKKNFNYGQTTVNNFDDPALMDTKNWKVVLEPKNTLMGLERYPEFKKLVMEIANETCKKINAEAPKIKSDMPYKCQFTLEEVIRVLESRV